MARHFLLKKLEEVITKWTKIGQNLRVFGEFKIVEFVKPSGLRFSVYLKPLAGIGNTDEFDHELDIDV